MVFDDTVTFWSWTSNPLLNARTVMVAARTPVKQYAPASLVLVFLSVSGPLRISTSASETTLFRVAHGMQAGS